MKKLILLIFLLISAGAFYPALAIAIDSYKGTAFDRDLDAAVYKADEILRYDVTWMGIKAGELSMEVKKSPDAPDRYVFLMTARTTGLLDLLYPVEDSFETILEGENRLPVLHVMNQKEGRRRNRKETVYDQQAGTITYRKNDFSPVVYTVTGFVHNEFSAFLAMRPLLFSAGQSVIVPTFADKKRHEVKVEVLEREDLETVLGRKPTISVVPRLPFKGLYEKVGDPQVWLTDDLQRIPVKISAKIKIGALTATLQEYARVDRSDRPNSKD